MTANAHAHQHEWGDEPTTALPAYRLLSIACGAVLIHVTPKGSHIVDLDCEGVCLVCNHPLEGN